MAAEAEPMIEPVASKVSSPSGDGIMRNGAVAAGRQIAILPPAAVAFRDAGNDKAR